MLREAIIGMPDNVHTSAEVQWWLRQTGAAHRPQGEIGGAQRGGVPRGGDLDGPRRAIRAWP